MFKKVAIVLLAFMFLLTACGGKTGDSQDTSSSDVNTSSESVSSENSENNDNNASTDDISGALNTLLGSDDEAAAFDSYHIEMTLDTPVANDDNTALVNEITTISADVAGKNVHIVQVDPGETASKEGYIIGDTDKEYKLIDGTWQEQMGFIALGWAMWPLTVVTPYAAASALYADKTGTEDVNGRTAFIYDIDTAKADPAVLAGIHAYLPDFSAKGTVWIDKETGAMLKLSLDYTENLSSLDGSTKLGIGNGHIELEVSGVNQTTVTSPV